MQSSDVQVMAPGRPCISPIHVTVPPEAIADMCVLFPRMQATGTCGPNTDIKRDMDKIQMMLDIAAFKRMFGV